MPVKLKPPSVIKAQLGIQPGGPVHKFFTQTCAIHMDKYVPFDTGALAETVIVNQRPTNNVHTDYIEYVQNYATIVYAGTRNGKPLNYQTDKHTQAGPYWDKRMWSAEKNKVVQEVQDYLKKYGGG